MADPTPTPAPAPKKTVVRNAQDQRIANDISDAEDLIDAVQADTEISALLAAKGYDADRIEVGSLLQQDASAAFDARQAAMGRQTSSGEVHSGAEDAAREAFADFRVIASNLFKDATARTTLGLNGRVAKDQQIFITNARAAYKAAGKAPYATEMIKAGYDAIGLAAAIATLDAMGSTNIARNSVDGAAKGATTTRDIAYKAMNAWIAGLTKVANVALRARPDLLAKLKM